MRYGKLNTLLKEEILSETVENQPERSTLGLSNNMVHFEPEPDNIINDYDLKFAEMYSDIGDIDRLGVFER